MQKTCFMTVGVAKQTRASSLITPDSEIWPQVIRDPRNGPKYVFQMCVWVRFALFSPIWIGTGHEACACSPLAVFLKRLSADVNKGWDKFHARQARARSSALSP
ncbi:hypothetical protein TM1040_1978 [Ruegeria sp. TM1040]|nr:hypothetical protein TM1040_1978 [Ruegeria sp. TM1040]